MSAVDGKVLEDRPIVNLGQGLQGAIPNLNVTTSGRPGQGSSFNIRGTTAMSGSSPLVLVDGVEMDPNLINPQDVKSVSVLKDAASASIYGARAAYGVVLITTKGGRMDKYRRIVHRIFIVGFDMLHPLSIEIVESHGVLLRSVHPGSILHGVHICWAGSRAVE